MKKNELLSTIEAGKIAGLSSETIKYHAARGALRAKKVAGRWAIRRGDLEAWMDIERKPGLKLGQTINRKKKSENIL